MRYPRRNDRLPNAAHGRDPRPWLRRRPPPRIDERDIDLIAARVSGLTQGTTPLERWVKRWQPVFIPVAIAAVGAFATIYVGNRETQTAVAIAKSGQAISKEIESGRRRTNELLESQRLRQSRQNAYLNTIEEKHRGIRNIIKGLSAATDPENEAQKFGEQIVTLRIYSELALPYLVDIRDELLRRDHQSMARTVKGEIATILIAGQLNLARTDFIGEAEIINLRNKALAKLDLRESRFERVNLYRADFTDSNLERVQFVNTDLAEANFTNANLGGAEFKSEPPGPDGSGATQRTTLRKANFERARLRGARFENVDDLDEAKFSIWELIQTSVPPFALVLTHTPDTYYRLLGRHWGELKKLNGSQPEVVKQYLSRIGASDLKELSLRIPSDARE